MRLSIFVATAAMLLASLAAHASDITYNVSDIIGGASAVGTIVTDGNLGTLTVGDIVSFALTVSSGPTSNPFNSSGGNLVFQGSDLTATSSGLFFNFDGTDVGGLVFADSTFSNYLCISSKSAVCDSFTGDDLLGGAQIQINGDAAYDAPMSGVGQIASSATVTPEPSSLILLGTGLLGIAGIMRKRLA